MPVKSERALRGRIIIIICVSFFFSLQLVTVFWFLPVFGLFQALLHGNFFYVLVWFRGADGTDWRSGGSVRQVKNAFYISARLAFCRLGYFVMVNTISLNRIDSSGFIKTLEITDQLITDRCGNVPV